MGFDNSSNIYAVPPEVNSVMQVVDTFLRHRAKSNERGHGMYHPSAFGKCLRLMQYQLYAEKGFIDVKNEEFDSTKLRLFDKGHNMHSRWAKYFEHIGVLRGYWTCTNPACQLWNDAGKFNEKNISYEINTKDPVSPYTLSSPRVYGLKDKLGCFKPKQCICGNRRFDYSELIVKSEELNMFGHCDMVLDFSNFDDKKFDGVKKSFNLVDLPKNPIVIDMKTSNDFGFKKVTQKGPDIEYVIQLSIYANILDVDFGILIYENKNTSMTASYKIDKNTDTVFAQVKQQAKKMVEMVELKLLPPPRPLDKDNYECSNCPFKGNCHSSKIWDDADLNNKRKKFYGNLL